MGQTTFSGPVASQNGFIENSFTTAERDAIVDPTAGLLIYNTTENTYQVYNGTGWQAAFGPPVPSLTTWGTTAWPSTYTLEYVFPAGMGMPGPSPLVINLTGYESNAAALLAYPIGTVFTVEHGTNLTAGDTFTLTSQYTNTGPGEYYAETTYAGAGFIMGSANVGQFSVA